MALPGGKTNDMIQTRKKTWDDCGRLRMGRDSLDSLSTIMSDGNEGIMNNLEELLICISRIMRRWCEEWVEVSKERIKDRVRGEEESNDEEDNEPPGEELGRIGPAIAELLAGWGNVWCIDTQRDMYNRHHMLREDTPRTDVSMSLCDNEEEDGAEEGNP